MSAGNAAAQQPRKALGRGLAALLGDDDLNESAGAPSKNPGTLPVARLRPGAGQPRTQFDDAAIETLAESIRMDGVLQPLIVRPCDDGDYEIVAGERRWRAAQRAQLHDVPVVIREMADDRAA
ncbi:MAG: ParB N-terminal domain-containing protein, partial [Pseudomonadota bacterium]